MSESNRPSNQQCAYCHGTGRGESDVLDNVKCPHCKDTGEILADWCKDRDREIERLTARVAELEALFDDVPALQDVQAERDRLRAALDEARDKHSRRHPQCHECYRATDETSAVRLQRCDCGCHKSLGGLCMECCGGA